MTSTATATDRSRALADEQPDYVRERAPYQQAPGQANEQAYVQRPSAVRALGVQEVCYLAVLSAVQLTWIALLAYGVVRMLS